MTDDHWGPWQEHTPGQPCPIPDAKAGEYMLRTTDGLWNAPSFTNAVDFNWKRVSSYRLRKPAVDWEALAREAVKFLDRSMIELHMIRMKDCDAVYDTLIRTESDHFLERARKAGIE